MTIEASEYHAKRLAAMPPEERAEFDVASDVAELSLDLAQAIYDARHEAGMTQAQLAAAMGVTQSYISNLEGGGSLPTLKTLARVARSTGGHLSVKFAA
ncbi:helix-turn-helix domain-containing protein [Brevibacterium sp. 91QC2O2]|uniref:helix-turn-helix domain-containing protein n=1 Tax=Brevibacterium TaxID=1696 RepID=UPI00211B958B|nr:MULTISPECIES: helix-turn-helix transcriptional regulator [unclassified Brevibacterium]MCQ9367141.1 helix-turn-helix domain-containing protein [Brevibacterium sp. 91QC2O2]MCQ9385412.1 helix-turn-helix domain-containing protein [Brevibacterium sp. 68QC2CO]